MASGESMTGAAYTPDSWVMFDGPDAHGRRYFTVADTVSKPTRYVHVSADPKREEAGKLEYWALGPLSRSEAMAVRYNPDAGHDGPNGIEVEVSIDKDIDPRMAAKNIAKMVLGIESTN